MLKIHSFFISGHCPTLVRGQLCSSPKLFSQKTKLNSWASGEGWIDLLKNYGYAPLSDCCCCCTLVCCFRCIISSQLQCWSGHEDPKSLLRRVR